MKFKLNFFKQIIPIYLRYLACLNSYQIQYDNQGLDIYFDEKTRQTIKEKYADFLTKSKSLVLGVVPGASFATKRWTAEGFQTVINYFIEQHQAKVILFGNASDRELIKSLNIKNSQAVLNTAGELSILGTGAVMDYCDVVITNDSGLMHLASALKKKVVAIFGSTTEDLGFFPSTTEHIVIENQNLKCRPCSHVGRHKCPKKHFKCMKEIYPEQVIEAVKRMLTILNLMTLSVRSSHNPIKKNSKGCK
ncbi:MAG: glycosyltransferase family 9 protein [Calditrichales bacterium]|nr:glycosyltransferase family 9 protein [Calditrichales bacterium]